MPGFKLTGVALLVGLAANPADCSTTNFEAYDYNVTLFIRLRGMHRNVRNYLIVILGLGCSALFLWLALRTADIPVMGAALKRADFIWALPFVLSLAAFCWLKAARWSVLLRPLRETHAATLVGPVVVGYMGTGLMPMQLGEIARAFLAARKLGVPLAAVVATLIVERVLDVFALLLVIGLAGTQFGQDLRTFGISFIVVGVGTLLGLWTFVTKTELCIKLAHRALSFAPPRWRDKVLTQMSRGALGVEALRRPASYVQMIALSIAQWACMCACTWFSLVAVGQCLPPAAALTTLATTIVSMTLPSGPGYVGTLQLAYVVALEPFGVAASDALAASVFYLAMLWVPLVGAGFILLHKYGWTMRELGSVTRGTDPL